MWYYLVVTHRYSFPENPFVNYRIQVIRQGEVIATLDVAEHPAEDYLDSLVATYAADFCDVCRLEPCEVE